MKKYLLSLLVIGLSFIGFSNAGHYELINTVSTVSTSFSCESSNFSNLSPGKYKVSFTLVDSLDKLNGVTFMCTPRNQGLSSENGDWYREVVAGYNCRSISLGFGNSSNMPSQCPVVSIYKYDDSFNMYYDGLTPIITGLENSVNEFIPYVVYIGLGLLSVVIGFFAIKWLLRYINKSSLGVFNSKKRK